MMSIEKSKKLRAIMDVMTAFIDDQHLQFNGTQKNKNWLLEYPEKFLEAAENPQKVLKESK